MAELIVTVDLEEWFQVENLRPWFPYNIWDQEKLKCHDNVYRLLNLFDEKGIHATFFVLAWIAEKEPSLIREIKYMGHEIASHGYYHTQLTRLDNVRLNEEFVKSKQILEDIVGSEVKGYRAPNFSINNKTLHLIYKSGYMYDSSYNSFHLNNRYGRPSILKKKTNYIYRVFNGFYEIPVSNLYIKNFVLPWAGGAYFRLIPSFLFCLGVKYILKKNGVYVFYIHPWEIDPYQRVPDDMRFQYRIRHYFNLKNTFIKLSNFFDSLKGICESITCSSYLSYYENSYNKERY